MGLIISHTHNALQIAVSCMNKEELGKVYGTRAKQLADEGKLREAERCGCASSAHYPLTVCRLYIAMDQPDPAINMYKKHRQVIIIIVHNYMTLLAPPLV